MTSVWMLVRTQLRARIWGTVALAALVGVLGGVVLAAAAGARRTDTAYSRFLSYTRAPDAFVIGGPPGSGIPPVDLQAVAKLPQVAESATGSAVFGVAMAEDGNLLWHGDLNITDIPPASLMERWFRPRILSGRLPDLSRVDEVAVGYKSHQDPRVHVGARIKIAMTKAAVPLFKILSGRGRPSDFLRPVTVKVVGVVVYPGELQGSSDVFVTPSFRRRYFSRTIGLPALVAHLRGGIASVPAFSSAVDGISTGAFQFSNESELSYVHRSTHVQAVALWIFAGLAAAAGMAVVGQVLSRQTFLDSEQNAAIRALGVTGPQLAAVNLTRMAVIGAAGAALAVVVAMALSPLTPVGSLARLAEPNPGLALDPLIVGVGAALLFLLVPAVAAFPTWRVTRAGSTAGVAGTSDAPRPSAAAEALSRAGLPASAVAGTRMALERGRGTRAAPVRSAVLGTAVSLMALVAALGLGASFNHLLTTPRNYGWDFDLAGGNPYAGDFGKKVVPQLRKEHDIAAFSVGNLQHSVGILGPAGHSRSYVFAFDPLEGSVHPTVAEGRWPRNTREIVLGTSTMRALGASLGGSVQVKEGGHVARLQVVGRAVFPDVGFGPGLGQGVGLTFQGLRGFFPGLDENTFLMKLGPGADAAAAQARINTIMKPYGADASSPEAGSSIGNLRKVKGVPLLLAALLAAAAALTLIHTLVTSIRLRRRDLAVLKTLGFVRRQVSATVAWQATTLALIALLIGIPLGLAAGRWGWNLFADQIGVVPDPIVPLLAVLIVVPATILAANLIAAGPAQVAARTRPAMVLRSE